MKLFDSHSHLNQEGWTEEERVERVRRIEEDTALKYVMDIGFDLESSRMAVRHAETYPWCFAAVGIHPHEAKQVTSDTLCRIRALSHHQKVKAIGEIGLDFHYDHSPRECQRAVFRQQIHMALEENLPIAVHSRSADQETMEILKEEGAFSRERTEMFLPRPVPEGWETAAADARVLLHCFSGSAELGEQYVRMGATLSVAGPVTYHNNKKTVKMVRRIPTAFLLAETDAPYMTPEPVRGVPNQSSYVRYVVRKMAEIQGCSMADMARHTCRNAERFYNITGTECCE